MRKRRFIVWGAFMIAAGVAMVVRALTGGGSRRWPAKEADHG